MKINDSKAMCFFYEIESTVSYLLEDYLEALIDLDEYYSYTASIQDDICLENQNLIMSNFVQIMVTM